MFRMLLAVALGFAPVVASAARAAPAPRQFAILLGNSDYNRDGRILPSADDPGNAMPDLASPCKDVAAVHKSLKPFDFQIIDQCNLDKPTFESALETFKASIADLPKGSIVLVYYSGHGLQFAGNVYSVPVGYNPEHAPNSIEPMTRAKKFLSTEMVQISAILKEFNSNPDIYIAVFIDSCRSIALSGFTGFNEDVIPRGNQNQYIVFSTNGGNTSKDDEVFSKIVSGRLTRGGDIRTIVGDVLYQDHVAFQPAPGHAQTKTYAADVFQGTDFKYGSGARLIRRPVGPIGSPVAVGGRKPPVQPGIAAKPSAPNGRSLEIISSAYSRGLTLDIFYCEGPDQAARYQFARAMADKVNAAGATLGIGSIRLKFISDVKNREPGYRVRTNLVRYDPIYPKAESAWPSVEREVGLKVAFGFPEGHFLLSPGIGVHGHATLNYISAFVCGPVGDSGNDG